MNFLASDNWETLFRSASLVTSKLARPRQCNQIKMSDAISAGRDIAPPMSARKCTQLLLLSNWPNRVQLPSFKVIAFSWFARITRSYPSRTKPNETACASNGMLHCYNSIDIIFAINLIYIRLIVHCEFSFDGKCFLRNPCLFLI